MCPIAPKSKITRTNFPAEGAPAQTVLDRAMNAMLRPDSPELSTLLPREVVTVVAEQRHRIAPVLVAEAEYMATRPMRPQREAEFRAGRACAREALLKMGIDGWPLLPAATREPRWPGDVVGSITHSGAYCAAALARGNEFAGIGIDVEATGRVGDELAPLVCNRSELAALDKCEPCARAAMLTLIFSAKESVFKAVFPRERLYLEFDDVEIEVEPATGACDGTFRARGRTPALERLLQRLEGRFAVGKANVATAAVLAHQGG